MVPGIMPGYGNTIENKMSTILPLWHLQSTKENRHLKQ
jgi:hypothetical protein